MTELLNSIRSELVTFGGIMAVIGMVVLGIIMIFKSLTGKGGMREAFSGFGGVAAGIIVIGAATAIVGALEQLASSLG